MIQIDPKIIFLQWGKNYLLYCIFSWFDIFVDRTIGSTGHRKGVDDVLDARYKWVLKLAMGNILNTG